MKFSAKEAITKISFYLLFAIALGLSMLAAKQLLRYVSEIGLLG